ncbi:MULTISPECIES: sugar phosphate isomerase/epimerase family protein [unclassified Sinorhizobium]|uniref:sugar phosphate isomerase/epimerase family protein n=1 Tax=unclassified Sinorhizobium TaxID=2613772 RepID=UPI0035244862
MIEPILSLQLFSMRALGDLDTQLSEAARAGFRAVEPLEIHLRDADTLREALQRHGLSAPSAHVGLDALRGEPMRFVDACRECGIEHLFALHPANAFKTETSNAWQRLGHELGTLAERFEVDGVVVGYHNKTTGFDRLLGGRYGFELMFDAAKGSPLVWQADIAWLARAQNNPAEWLKRYRNVLVSAHIKDQAPDGVSPPEEEGWTDVGSGILVWPALWRIAITSGARLLVVEHDNPLKPFEFAQRSLTYLRRFTS